MDRPTVLLLFGGESSEHDVSISSARNVYAAIDDEKYDVLLGYIDREGRWWLLDSFGMQVDTHSMPQLLPALGSGSFVTTPDSRVVTPDAILPILHGRGGEDGSVQGLAQLMHIPIVGCDVTASAIGMDKLASKEILMAHHISVAPYQVHHDGEVVPDFGKLTMTLGCPVFVKPSRAGSSIGVSKVYSEEELVSALEEAHRHDPTVLIEQAITARELEVAVLGTPPQHQVSVVGEILPGADFYDYEDKYAADSRSSVVIPADIESGVSHRIQALAGRIYELLGGSGLARIDFFLSDDGALYFNEINTLPGFTSHSMYPKLWRHEGISYAGLIDVLLNDALGRATIKPESKEEEEWKH